MADLAGLGGVVAILHIAKSIARMIAQWSDLKKASDEMQEFRLSCSNFGVILQSFYQVSKTCTRRKQSSSKKWQKQILGLILQARQVDEEMKSFLKGLDKSRGDGPLMDIKEWIAVLFRGKPVRHLKLNMSTACAYISTFVTIVMLDTLQEQVESARGEDKEELEEQM